MILIERAYLLSTNGSNDNLKKREGIHMQVFDFDKKKIDGSTAHKFAESLDLDTRIIEFVLLEEDNGIPPHIHPHGEDCAYILEGELQYNIDFDETITVKEGELVVGWTDLIHSYKNVSTHPVHFLVFATPEFNKTVYPERNVDKVKYLPITERKYNCLRQEFHLTSPFTTYSTVEIDGLYAEEVEGAFKSFLDLEDKRLYVFNEEEVLLVTEKRKRFLKFAENK
jgi:mannose-6-phosphate isomerase-like protein (cupin superfamily)